VEGQKSKEAEALERLCEAYLETVGERFEASRAELRHAFMAGAASSSTITRLTGNVARGDFNGVPAPD
jgi:hypothetical protein